MKAGKFLMSKEFYDSDWEIVSGVFKYFKPYKVEYSYEDRGWWFIGTSEFFEEVGGINCSYITEVPRYEVLIQMVGTNKSDTLFNFTFQKYEK